MSKFLISAAPEFYGSDATESEAETCADLICAAAAKEFPKIKFESVLSNNVDNRGVDEEGEIQQWINDNWTVICS